MAIDTKPNFSSNKFEQCSGDIMNLSGCTQIYGLFDIETGATLTICGNAGVGKILTSNSTGIASWEDVAVSGITSISGGSGMNFSPITTTGEIILGTPNAILNTSIDISSGTTHHHAFSASTFVTGTQGILVDGTNKFYLDDIYVADAVLPNLHTVTGVDANQSLGDLPSGQTLGMVYITNTGSTTAYLNLGTTALGDDITPYQTIQVDAGEDVSVTVNMRLSLTADTTIYINSDDWTNVGLNVQWANVTFKNVPLPTGSTGGGLSSSSNGLNDNGTNVKLGGSLTENTCIAGGGSNYGLTFSGSSYYTIDNTAVGSSSINLLAQGQVCLEGCNVSALIGGATFDIRDLNGDEQIQFGTGGDVRFCNLATKTTESDVVYINSSTGRLVTGTVSGGTTSPAGADGDIQYNNGGTFGGTCLNWDDSLNHMGWNTTAKSDAMLAMKKDVPYATLRNILEFFSCDSFEIEDLSMVKVEVCGYNAGGGIHLQNICGYNSGTVSNLCLCGNNNVYIYATDYVAIHSVLKLNPTSAPGSPQEGMVFYDYTANKLKFYNGTAWETVTSSV